ncbi:hypothetical protein CAPTEDRAFT_224432 [Capitella teleta]|uniref:Uncharacterized protein n=1 Tax=Capitella teleta TaxID=283909 RepID=R7TN60_CAPTE|nr:hypothetical protein CAPTEDRAFT_224432 [Capitella teleta]|eukprot:ELT95079.1 hypothetical protein CAPTEDRAFT_224432 [Capitella teleta]
MQSELEQLRHKQLVSGEEVAGLRIALEESRSNGERLHKESELVVQNVNTWVREQKQANEKLGKKIREQSKAIMALSAEKDNLSEQLELVVKENKRLVTELDEKRLDYDKFRSLQNHSAHQQVLLHQLRNRLEEYEDEQDKDVKDKLTTIEDLHSRLKTNVENVQQLHSKVSQLERENSRIRGDLERENGAMQTLQLQLESKEQVISSLRAQLDSRAVGSRALAMDKAVSKIDAGSLTNLKQPGTENRQEFDKNYWMQRVEELSVQLQRSENLHRTKEQKTES